MQKFSLNVQTYEHKRTENEMVKKELNLLDEEDVVYKLVGPVLVKEDTAEAKMNVEKRLEFINKEM
jgi:prefoldin beta subunit